jgi:hypothetical protein
MSLAEDFFVCGFGEPAAGIGGLAWDFGAPGALLLVGGEAKPATFAVEEGGDAVTLELSAAEASVEATLSPRTPELPLGNAGLGVVVCVADAVPKGAQTVECAGQISRWGESPLDGLGTFRHLAIDAGDQSLVVVESRGDPRGDHGDEARAAWQIRGEEDSSFEDAFVSTQYDSASHPTRLGVELWPEEAERASRAAATRVAAASLGGVEVGDAWAGLFRCQTDGVLGMGSYLLWRR